MIDDKYIHFMLDSESSKKCFTCDSLTKRVIMNMHVNKGSQPHEWHVQYACDSETCERAIAYREMESESKARQAAIDAENEANGVNPDVLKEKRIGGRYYNMREMARMLKIEIPMYSSYENKHKPMPRELYDRAMDIAEVNE